MRDPKTHEEWQEAVELSRFLLVLDSCRQYGLITGGPECNVARCDEVLNRGAQKGIRPRPGSTDRLLRAFLESNGPQRSRR